MLVLIEIIDKLKDVIAESLVGKKVFDKDVADALQIPHATFATMKKRNSIPYHEILEFCALKKISVNWLFFDQAVDMLKEELKPKGEKFYAVDEGDQWTVIDLGDILIHLMVPEYRTKYNLEEFLEELSKVDQEEG